jgi:hypothetical protein
MISPPPHDAADEISVREHARRLIAEGRRIVPVSPRSKKPDMNRWPNLVLTEDDLPAYFSNGNNLGVLTVGGLVDVDLDCHEARELGRLLLPATKRRHGRPSARDSHWWYDTSTEMPYDKFDDPDFQRGDPRRARIVEQRSGHGHQTLVPPSVHPDGEALAYSERGAPAHVDGPALARTITLIAALVLVVRTWPARGLRHEASKALAGTLLRCGLEEDTVVDVVVMVAQLAGDEEANDRAKDVATTARRLREGGDATGLPALLGTLQASEARRERISEWLGMKGRETRERAPRPPWPEMARAAYHGVVGKIVDKLAPLTEADAAAILLNLVVLCGWRMGRGREVRVGADRHGTNEYLCLVGDTSRARKGMASNLCEEVMRAALRECDPTWVDGQQASGLGSGEGLIAAVRDRVEREGKKGEIMVVDEGVADKRVLFRESEFGMILRAMERDGNTISARMREGWDGRDLHNTVKGSPLRATKPHISFLGHITEREVAARLTSTEYANGFGNRFLWACCRRQRDIALPEQLDFTRGPWPDLLAELHRGLEFGASGGGIVARWSEEAQRLYEDIYPTLDVPESEPDTVAADLLARGPAHVVRLSLIYACLDCSATIEETHVRAALACWEYCSESVLYIFHDVAVRPSPAGQQACIDSKNTRGVKKTDALLLGLEAVLFSVANSGTPDPEWTGTAAELHQAVERLRQTPGISHELAEIEEYWPSNAVWLGRALNAERERLAERGIAVTPVKRYGERLWQVSQSPGGKYRPYRLAVQEEPADSGEPF